MAADMLPKKIFTYGTLMTGFSNHFLVEESVYLGKARTVEQYALFTAEYPYVNSTINEISITGELYEVQTNKILQYLDELEGHPDVYIRTPCKVTMMDSGDIEDAEIYFYDRAATSGDGIEKVHSGNFCDSATAFRHLESKNLDNFRIPWSEIDKGVHPPVDAGTGSGLENGLTNL
mmetsp:Transcript_2317/g.3650  ORF Transcript_2317/g.3650 Transcript_2317/m.3650 type:complete len:176 (-) Transcript_2317:344-871(-)|eukprot:CAMPEP_0175004108 /NCGR_PEP_ID=MMETSP0005-20121125/4584_1 /TAXON_ID=420556 /ORGANISM="Ochromonas sp., Strain CCMP1393" /LENGTH=175 /DNA_ID=CAMNT_0016259225 /DNA_START=14 /DNA_END=541 /DNA_ORIENTATION=-